MQTAISTDGYLISKNKDERGPFILAESNFNKKNRAVYRHYFEKKDGVLKRHLITFDSIDKVFDSVAKHGITTGFHIQKHRRKAPQLYPKNHSDIRYKKSNQEASFTSTGEKLDHHWPIFQKYRDTGYSSIIRATMTLHQVCASRCSFCSTINRTRKDAISLVEAQKFVTELNENQAAFNKRNFKTYNDQYREITGSDIRLRGLILSGGGQPNLWPYFSEFVKWLSTKGIELGLITNGFPKHVKDDVYRHFKWIRLSITPEDASPFYPEQRFDKQAIPQSIIKNEKQTFGLSYVHGPWTDDGMLTRLDDAAKAWNASYVRTLTDCNLPRQEQLETHQNLAGHLYQLGLIDSEGTPKSKTFQQMKYHGSEHEIGTVWDDKICGLQLYNTFWDTTGHEENGESYCFPCDSVTVLEEGFGGAKSERRFNGSKWGTVLNTEICSLYKNPTKIFFDPKENCKGCLFLKNNIRVKALTQMNDSDYTSLSLENNLDHVNFP